MSTINVNNLTFSYDTSYDTIFDNVSFKIDTDWKLGFLGRNGRGKTTFLKLLMGEYSYSGTISSTVRFDYFPFHIKNQNQNTRNAVKDMIAPFSKWEKEMDRLLKENSEESISQYGEVLERYQEQDGYIIDSLIEKEIMKLDVPPDVLNREFCTLSNGERTKIMLAGLFLKKNNFLLIDEPTNHLDCKGRKIVARYLDSKKGFILVSHDRDFLDKTIDHVLSINRNNIEVQSGNYSSWKENKDRQDEYELSENEKLKKDIVKLKAAFERTAKWSDDIEKSKIGTHVYDRGFIGHKSAKMMKRAKNAEKRQQNAIDNKSNLLKNIEQSDALKIKVLPYHKKRYVEITDLSIYFGKRVLFDKINFEVNEGDRVVLKGWNGCGKSCIIKLITGENYHYYGKIALSSGLKISYVPQDTSFLQGNLKDYAEKSAIDESLFKAILRKLDFSRVQFEKDMREFSQGQKKKVVIAKSLSESANLYIWDEPLNFMDILSRVQIEELILKYNPTMIFVEHDEIFCQKIATKTIALL